MVNLSMVIKEEINYCQLPRVLPSEFIIPLNQL